MFILKIIHIPPLLKPFILSFDNAYTMNILGSECGNMKSETAGNAKYMGFDKWGADGAPQRASRLGLQYAITLLQP